MRHSFEKLAFGCLLIAMVASAAHAQWLNYKESGVPRTADGRPRLDAPPPKFFDGHPDLSGVWMHDFIPIEEMKRLFGAETVDGELKTEVPGMEAGNVHKYTLDVLIDFPADQSPARPEAKKLFEDRVKNPPASDLCSDFSTPIGFPLAGLLSEPIKIVQAPKQTMVLYEVGGDFRQIYSDGRRLPAEINLPAYLGYSIGRWERDSFVVETTGFNNKIPLDGLGHPRSERLRIVERYRRPDFGHLQVEMTFDDPTFYTRAWTIKFGYHLLVDTDIFEMYSDNEKDCAHIDAAQKKP